MTLYFLIAIVLFAVNAAMTFTTKTVSDAQLGFSAFVFVLTYFACGLPLEGFLNQLAAGALCLIVGITLIVTARIGGGVVRAFVIAGLWIPTWTLFFEYVMFATMVAGFGGAIWSYIKKSDRVEHFAGIALACCFGFFAYHYSEKTPEKLQSTTQVYAAQTVPEPAIALRGLASKQ